MIVGSSFMAIVSCLGVLVVGMVMGITLAVWQLPALLALAIAALTTVCLVAGTFLYVRSEKTR